MQFDRHISISTAGSRKAIQWQSQQLFLSELYEKLRTPARSPENYSDYMQMPKTQQDELKDVGGYVLGTLRAGRRKAGQVISREVITLDIDNLAAGSTDSTLRQIHSLGCGYCVYSTRKHSPGKPRLRVLLPLDRAVTADEYEAIARKVAQYIDASMHPFDPTTFQPHRLMYWPSCCADGEYIFRQADAPLISADGILATYTDWHDMTEWPQVPGTQSPARLAARQGDPTEKPGIIGAFCRVYDVETAMERFLGGVYTPAGEGRYTYAEGSTTGGAILYDGGKFLYSHHATDPCSGRLVNAFDLVRLHRFGELDDEAKPDTPTNRLPSAIEMTKLAAAEPEVQHLLDFERLEQLKTEFGTPAEAPAETDLDWMRKLTRNPNTGKYEKTIDNVRLILQHDPLCAGVIGYDEFSSRITVAGALPWNHAGGIRPWEDADDTGARWYLEKAYGITGREKVQDGVCKLAMENSYDPVRSYLDALVWDGELRLDTLYIDYLGAADTPYTRAAARKALCAAVARAQQPGTKFDVMTILAGPQGIGKSTLIRLLGRDWFTDSIKTFEGKEADEIMRGMWLIEISELEAMSRSEIGRVKQVLSQTVSRFRAAYGRNVQDCPRRCVFFGTSNNAEYLRDSTGGRRFWPVDVGVQQPTKSVFSTLADEVDQLWAEAVYHWKQGEQLYMTGDLAEQAVGQQEAHRVRNPLEGVISDWLAKPIPVDWSRWDLQRRRMFWGGGCAAEVPLVDRQQVCALEIWCELLDGDKKTLQRKNTMEINDCLQQLEGWTYSGKSGRYDIYGIQRGFIRQL